MKNDHAVSEIIGSVLIVILVVALAAVIVALFMGLIDLTPRSAFIAPDISGQTINGKNVIKMYNRGGDTATLNMSGQGQYPMSVWVDTSSGSYRAVPAPGVNLFSPGTNLYVYSGTGNYQSGGYQITNNISALNSNGGVYYPIGVRLIDDASHLLIIRWNSTGSTGGILAGHLLFREPNWPNIIYTYPTSAEFNATTTLKISAQIYPIAKTGVDVYNREMYFIAGKGNASSGTNGQENYGFTIATAPLVSGGSGYKDKTFWFEYLGTDGVHYLISKGPSDGWPYPKKDEWTTISLTVKDNVLTYTVGGLSKSTTLPSPVGTSMKTDPYDLRIGNQNVKNFNLTFKGEMNNVVVTNQV